jgi:hypothetical protein
VAAEVPAGKWPCASLLSGGSSSVCIVSAGDDTAIGLTEDAVFLVLYRG